MTATGNPEAVFWLQVPPSPPRTSYEMHSCSLPEVSRATNRLRWTGTYWEPVPLSRAALPLTSSDMTSGDAPPRLSSIKRFGRCQFHHGTTGTYPRGIDWMSASVVLRTSCPHPSVLVCFLFLACKIRVRSFKIYQWILTLIITWKFAFDSNSVFF